MAQNIGKKRGKSPIKTRLEQERKAGRRDPEGKKAFQKGLAIASLAIPGGAAVKAGAKVAKVAKAAKNKAVKKVAKKTREFNKNLAESNKLVKAEKSGYPLKNIKASAKDKSARSLIKNMKEFKKNYGADNLARFISGIDKPKKGMKKGGIVKKHRGDGIAKRGRTRGRIV
jgi:predicted metalloendopeptidase